MKKGKPEVAMILIGVTADGSRIFSAAPGDVPCMVRLVPPGSRSAGPEMMLASIVGGWSLLDAFDRDAWAVLKEPVPSAPEDNSDAAVS